MTFATPIAFCIFNRPEPTRRVFEAIARRKPARLLLIADGPRANLTADADLVAQTRSVVAQIDWDCQVQHNYADDNLGCRDRMASGLAWAFQQAEELIILEDDCLPDDSFFDFCETLLEKYRDHPEVMMISGNNFQPRSRSENSYYFSRYTHNWGWASWRRAWHDYDVEMKDWPTVRAAERMRNHFDSQREYEFWRDVFDRQHAELIDTWDYAWAYACMKQNGLTIHPEVNLVSNLGFGVDATHTLDANSPLSELPSKPLSHLSHPKEIHRHRLADEWTFANIFCPQLAVPQDTVRSRKPMRFFEKIFAGWARHSA